MSDSIFFLIYVNLLNLGIFVTNSSFVIQKTSSYWLLWKLNNDIKFSKNLLFELLNFDLKFLFCYSKSHLLLTLMETYQLNRISITYVAFLNFLILTRNSCSVTRKKNPSYWLKWKSKNYNEFFKFLNLLILFSNLHSKTWKHPSLRLSWKSNNFFLNSKL